MCIAASVPISYGVIFGIVYAASVGKNTDGTVIFYDVNGTLINPGGFYGQVAVIAAVFSVVAVPIGLAISVIIVCVCGLYCECFRTDDPSAEVPDTSNDNTNEAAELSEARLEDLISMSDTDLISMSDTDLISMSTDVSGTTSS